VSLGRGEASKRRSSVASSMAAMACQSNLAATPRPTYLVTTPLEMPKAVAICWWDSPPSNLRRRASLSLRILILTAGMGFLAKKGKKLHDPQVLHMRNTAPMAYTVVPIGVTVCVGHDHRKQRSRCRNPPGHLRRTSGHVPGIAGHVGPEYSETVGWAKL
jgi:hypothetical protein